MPPVPTPPRAIIPTHPAPILKFIARLFLLAVIAATMVLCFGLLHELLFKAIGRDTSATVSSTREVTTSSGAGKYFADVTYTLPNHAQRTDTLRINWTAHRRMSTPAILANQPDEHVTFTPDKSPTLPIRAYAIGPFAYARANEHEWGFLFMLIPAIFAPLGLLLSFALYLVIILRPRWRRALYTQGIAVPGTICRKYISTTKYGYIHYLQYTFTPQGATAPLYNADIVRPKAYEAVSEGAPVTVLYNPLKPHRNTMYEYGGYRWT